MVFVILMTLFFRDLQRKPHLKVGTLALIYMVAYSLGRFWIEGLRTDSLMIGPLRIAQLVSLGLVALGIIGLAWLYLARRSLPDVVPPQNQQWDTRAE